MWSSQAARQCGEKTQAHQMPHTAKEIHNLDYIL